MRWLLILFSSQVPKTSAPIRIPSSSGRQSSGMRVPSLFISAVLSSLEPSGTCPGPAPDTSGTGFAASRLARQTRLRSRSYALRTATGSAGCAGGAGLKMATSVRQSLAIMSPSVSQSLQKGREFGASKWRDQPFGGARGFRPAYLSARRLSGAKEARISLILLVGVAGFEPATPSSRTRCSTSGKRKCPGAVRQRSSVAASPQVRSLPVCTETDSFGADVRAAPRIPVINVVGVRGNGLTVAPIRSPQNMFANQLDWSDGGFAWARVTREPHLERPIFTPQ